MKAPCMKCETRYQGCHSRCSGYQEYRKSRAEITNNKIRESDYDSYLQSAMKRMRGM